VVQVDIAASKSKWYGESEKRVKDIFDRYRRLVRWCRKEKHRVPILLFNEADALIGKRMEFGDHARSVDQTANALQNIILQEIENLEGILIATTNLTSNMDAAFERRFLYKIEFEKPAAHARRAIWQSLMTDLDETAAAELSKRFDFSGGQIENVARKRTVERILAGGEVPLDTLIDFCKDETLAAENGTAIGFGVC
jgi:SpoVK/Ycf46/Vps4 family AAA+-type ATPase